GARDSLTLRPGIAFSRLELNARSELVARAFAVTRDRNTSYPRGLDHLDHELRAKLLDAHVRKLTGRKKRSHRLVSTRWVVAITGREAQMRSDSLASDALIALDFD